MEPYEWQARFAALIFFLLGVCIGVIWQNVGGMLVFFWIATAGSMAPYFIDHLKAKAKHVDFAGVKTFSAHDPSPIAITADDPDEGVPALALVPFGGAAASGFHMRDGGTAINSGGYAVVPLDQIHPLSRTLTHISVIPQECTIEEIEGISPHFLAAIESHGWHPVNSRFYVAMMGESSFSPPTLKRLNQQNIQTMKDGLLTTAKSEAQQALATVVQHDDVIKLIREPEQRKRRRERHRAEAEDEEARNGD